MESTPGTGRPVVEEDLLGHLLKANDPATQRRVEERLARDPAAPHELSVLRAALAPLAADREEIEPPDELWIRTLGRVAEHIVTVEGLAEKAAGDPVGDMIRRAAAKPALRPAPRESNAGPTAPRRRNVFAIIALSVAVLALVFPAVVHLRARGQQMACQDSMHQFYQATIDYSTDHDGRFPQVGEGERVASVVDTLKSGGYLSDDVKIACPGAPSQDGPVVIANYAYTLGFREDGTLHGLARRPHTDLLPIFADAPIRNAVGIVPVNHRHGQNVLFAGGNVRFCTSPKVGVDGDDIFYNDDGQVAAGKKLLDTVLGRYDERP